MSKDKMSKKIAKKAARRAERKLPVHEAPSGSDILEPLADFDVINSESVDPATNIDPAVTETEG